MSSGIIINDNKKVPEKPYLSPTASMLKTRQELGRVVNMHFPMPTYPGKKFQVALIGIDQFSYGYVHLATLEAWFGYTEFLTNLRFKYILTGERIPFEEIELGMFVIARVRRGFSAYYVRAEVLSKSQSSQHIRCLNIDEFEEFNVPKEQVYYGSEEAQHHPKRAIKMEIAGLSRFLHTDLVQQAFQRLDVGNIFSAELMGNGAVRHPTLRLRTEDGLDLTMLILQQLWRMLPRDTPLLK